MDIKIKKVHPNAHVPFRSTEGAAGYDLSIPEEVVIRPGRNVIPLGFVMEFCPQIMALIKGRSGFNLKGMEGILLPDDGTSLSESEKENMKTRLDIDVLDGVIDSDYRGEPGVVVKSHLSCKALLLANTRIAQMIFIPVCTPELQVVDELSETNRGTQGWGHTGTGSK